jgi:dTDP-4-dehydrorhamnose 3,5-epimerase
MVFKKTNIPGVVICHPKIFGDERGYFFESFNQSAFEKFIGHEINFCQDNESKSSYGVLRGLHFQKPPFTQSKLVRAIKGSVLDVIVDLRVDSETFGKSFSIELNGKSKVQLFIPKGLAHGFVVLSEEAVFSYKVDNYYAPDYEDGLMYNDKTLDIDWNINLKDVKLSEKDIKNNNFADIYKFSGELYK